MKIGWQRLEIHRGTITPPVIWTPILIIIIIAVSVLVTMTFTGRMSQQEQEVEAKKHLETRLERCGS